MKQQQDKDTFLDKNTLISVALVFVAWLSWDAYMRKKYPSPQTPPDQQKNFPTDQETEPSGPGLTTSKALPNTKGLPLNKPLTEDPLSKSTADKEVLDVEKTFSFESDQLSFTLSSRGMGFKKVALNRILDRKGKAVYLFTHAGEKNLPPYYDKNQRQNYLLKHAPDKLPFETRFIRHSKPLFFDIQQVSKNRFEGKATWKGVEIKKTLTVQPESFLIQAYVQLTGDLNQVYGVSTLLSQSPSEEESKKHLLSFLIPPDFLSFFVSTHQGFERFPLMSNKPEDVREQESLTPLSLVKVVGLGTRYFGQAWMEDKSDVLPQFQIRFQKGPGFTRNLQKREEEIYQNGRYVGLLQHFIENPQKDFELSYKIFMGPKDFAVLEPALTRWVDFGWFDSLARFILQVLRLFHSMTGNWGWSIILLTLLVRLLLLPLVLSSHRSMEVMKKVNPEVQKLRAKFKKDPQRLNQEIMAVMKSHKANPLGGCLPLLLQIPVFWALWKALSNSYSLYQAPFLFWIRDLSWKDPYYVLPALMGVFMFVQQKISPISINKEMARAMKIMPIFITFFMINLPSGLVLYMLISTLFGLGQQVYLNKTGENSGLITNLNQKKG